MNDRILSVPKVLNISYHMVAMVTKKYDNYFLSIFFEKFQTCNLFLVHGTCDLELSLTRRDMLKSCILTHQPSK